MKKLWEQFPDFQPAKQISTASLRAYEDRVPGYIVDHWKKHGLGTWMDGYLRVVDPAEWDLVLRTTLEPPSDGLAVLFTTAMGDLLAIENSDSIVHLNYRHLTVDYVGGTEFFFDDLADGEILDDELCWSPYREAVLEYGIPEFNMCFGYVPILAAGGRENVGGLKVLSMKEHLMVVFELAGQLRWKG